MNKELEVLTKQLEKNPHISDEQLKSTIKKLDFRLPNDYLEFLRENDGCEGVIGENNYLTLWKVENLIDWNNKYNVDTYAPGYFIFGSNGGGTAYAFNKKDSSVVAFEFIGMLMEDSPIILGSDFTSFLRYLFEN